MLKELSRYENLGTPGYHFYLLKILKDNPQETWSINNISELFHNRVFDGRSLFDGCLPLLNSIGVIEINHEQEIQVDDTFLAFLESEKQMCDRLVERIIVAVNNDEVFHGMFCSEFISYDVIYRTLQIDNAAFPLKFASFKQLLIDFNILEEHPTKTFSKYIINGRYRKIFDKIILPEIKKRKIGIEAFRRLLEENLINGEEAEKFVLDFEHKRLNGTKEVNWVAEYSPSDGYDIASYESEHSEEHDRFIEVKSFAGEPYFYWSRNEMDTARIKKNSYYLYLVNRNNMHSDDYTPIIIQNPYDNIYKNQLLWEQRIEKIRFQKIV